MMNPLTTPSLHKLQRTATRLRPLGGGEQRLLGRSAAAPLLLLLVLCLVLDTTAFSPLATLLRPRLLLPAAATRRASALVADADHHHHGDVAAASEWYAPPPLPRKEDSVKLPAGVVPDVRTIESHVELQEFLAEDDRLCVIKFYASWCKSCQKFGLHFDKLAAQKADWVEAQTGQPVARPHGPADIRVACIEYGSCTSLCRSLGIQKLPTVNFYSQGQKVGGLAAGPSKFAKVREALAHYLSLSPDELRFEAEMERGSDMVKQKTAQALEQQAQQKTEAVIAATTSADEEQEAVAASSSSSNEKPRRRSWWRRKRS